jgi:hypothetical protein
MNQTGRIINEKRLCRNAAVFGLSKELNLKGTQYNFALCIFFIPYILLEVRYVDHIPKPMHVLTMHRSHQTLW